jgi:hypothetical protein
VVRTAQKRRTRRRFSLPSGRGLPAAPSGPNSVLDPSPSPRRVPRPEGQYWRRAGERRAE